MIALTGRTSWSTKTFCGRGRGGARGAIREWDQRMWPCRRAEQMRGKHGRMRARQRSIRVRETGDGRRETGAQDGGGRWESDPPAATPPSSARTPWRRQASTCALRSGRMGRQSRRCGAPRRSRPGGKGTVRREEWEKEVRKGDRQGVSKGVRKEVRQEERRGEAQKHHDGNEAGHMAFGPTGPYAMPRCAPEAWSESFGSASHSTARQSRCRAPARPCANPRR